MLHFWELLIQDHLKKKNQTHKTQKERKEEEIPNLQNYYALRRDWCNYSSYIWVMNLAVQFICSLFQID